MTLKNQLMQFQDAQNDRMLDFFKQSHARVGLGHTGGHIKLTDWLDFQAGFAAAKDAVFSEFDVESIRLLCGDSQHENYVVNSQAKDATQFLLRPDLGRLLSSESHVLLEQISVSTPFDLLIVISGGLSPLAILHHVPHFLPLFLAEIRSHAWSSAPIIITTRSRVAFGDQVNQYFKAAVTVMLIGERPGLTTPDSLGIYITYNAKPGCTDEQRNCISNIHAHGLSYADAASKLAVLLKAALKSKFTGILN